MQPQVKRLFFAMEVHAPWPEELPKGRLIQQPNRHLTLAFLGSCDFTRLQEALLSFPEPEFKVGFVGKFDQCVFLPKRHPRVCAWHIEILEDLEPLKEFQKTLGSWLKEREFPCDVRHDFNPHVTLARAPFDQKKWKDSFKPLPFMLKDIHLFESTGNLQYHSLWNFPLNAPFEPIEHTADIAFWIRGRDYEQLYKHAECALAFSFPDLLDFTGPRNQVNSITEIIEHLNELVFRADSEIGCPFKAVSLHTDVKQEGALLEWEMIVDV